MSNRNYCTPEKFRQNHQFNNSTTELDRYKLPAINNGTAIISPTNDTSITRPCVSQTPNNYSTPIANLRKIDCSTTKMNNLSNSTPYGSANYNPSIPSYNNHKTNCSPRGIASSQTFSSLPLSSGIHNSMQSTSANRTWSSNRFVGLDKTNMTDTGANKNPLINQNNNSPPRPMTSGPGSLNRPPSNRTTQCGQKTIVLDRQLANEILQKAGLPPSSTRNDCFEVITDAPVTVNDNVNCDPNPLCMKKPADCQECYEQSIVVRHLQPPPPPVPAPIIIRERCAQPAPPQPPIVIRQIPPRPSTPPPLIIRECPPPMPDLQEPTIIEREVPPPPPPPRQVIVERLPTPPPKPRSIIFEKWLPYEEPVDRPCIIEKAVANEAPPPRNMIIQYEAREPKIQSQCINEGISYVDPKQFVNDKPNGNVEVCYVDQLNNLPDHIKCQLSPEVLAAIGIPNGNKPNINNNPYGVRTNPPGFCQQNTRGSGTSMFPMAPRQAMMANGCHSPKPPFAQQARSNMYHLQQPTNRMLSASASGSPHCYSKYNTSTLARPSNQGFNNVSRAHYNPWATTYQVSYTNKARGICGAR